MQEIRPGGLIVKLLSDGRNGYIRRRELSWDRRAQAQLTLPAIGALIEAKIIDDPSILHYVPLSVRQLSDPCQNAKGKYLRGQTVRGEVVNVRLNGVYVQIEPGIDAFLPTEEYPIPPSQSTEFFPLIGDQIAATITIIDEGNHQIHLSVLQRLRELNPFTFERRKMFLLDQFMETVNRPLFNAVTGERASQHRKEGGTTQRYRPPLPRFDSVLVVDDEDNYLLELWDFIEDIFNVTVVGTGSGRDALALISGSVTFDLVMIDITLKGESGIEVARRMLAVCPNLEIIFISHNPIREKDIPFLFGRRFQFAAKQSEEIVSAIEKVVDGYWELITSEQRVLSTDRGGFIGQLGIIAESAEPSSNKLTQMLAALKKKVAVTHALLLEVDTYCQPVSILVKKGKPLLKAVE